MSSPHTIVEVIEHRPDHAPCVRINEVRINGQPVRVLKDGIDIDYDVNLNNETNILQGGVVGVTLTLLVDEFKIHQVTDNT